MSAPAGCRRACRRNRCRSDVRPHCPKIGHRDETAKRRSFFEPSQERVSWRHHAAVLSLTVPACPLQQRPSVQEAIDILGAMIFPTFESVETTFTPDQFLRFVQDQEGLGSLYHYELLDGRIYMTPPAGGPHSVAQGNLFALLAGFVRERNLGRVYGSSAGYRLPSETDVVEPDVAFVSNERHAAMPPMVQGQFLRVVPDLMIEVLSPSHEKNDLVRKRAVYEKNGVREYWIIDPSKQEVHVLILRVGRFRDEPVVDASGTVEAQVLRGFRIAVRDIFAD